MHSSFLVVLALFFIAACSQSPKRNVAQDEKAERWKKLDEFVTNLNLTEEGTTLKMSSGGTSVYAVINRGGQDIGAVIPENAATKLSGEVMSFYLAKILGYADIYQPGLYFHLDGKNLKAFTQMIPLAKMNNKLREEN